MRFPSNQSLHRYTSVPGGCSAEWLPLIRNYEWTLFVRMFTMTWAKGWYLSFWNMCVQNGLCRWGYGINQQTLPVSAWHQSLQKTMQVSAWHHGISHHRKHYECLYINHHRKHYSRVCIYQSPQKLLQVSAWLHSINLHRKHYSWVYSIKHHRKHYRLVHDIMASITTENTTCEYMVKITENVLCVYSIWYHSPDTEVWHQSRKTRSDRLVSITRKITVCVSITTDNITGVCVYTVLSSARGAELPLLVFGAGSGALSFQHHGHYTGRSACR